MNTSVASYGAAGGSQSFGKISALDSSINSGTSFLGNPNETSLDDEDVDDPDDEEDEDGDNDSVCSKPQIKKKSEKAKWSAAEVRISILNFNILFKLFHATSRAI